MPSSGKTPFLGLNRFTGSDKPKMEDFNFDNQQVDAAVGAHLADAVLHLSTADRAKLGAVQLVQGSYIGTGASSRTLTLADEPAFGLLFTAGTSPWRDNAISSGQTQVMGGFFTSAGCTAGISLTGKALTISHTMGTSMGEYHYTLNETQKEYRYIYFKKCE